MAGLSERQIFGGYGVPYDDAIPSEPEPAPARLHVLTPLEIRQRVAAHQERMAEQRAVQEVRVVRLRAGG